jgi:hypothetical protein
VTGDEAYADRVVKAAMVAATGGLDPDRVAQVVSNVVEAIDKQAAALKNATYQPEDYERIARAMAHAMKSADGLYRLVEFASGRPDSRPDKGMDWLRGLTDEQLRIVQGWVDANGHAGEAPALDGCDERSATPHRRRSAP